MDHSQQALAGIRVLEYCQFVSGPFCGRMLAGFGAEVTKIEQPGSGDMSRSRGPFWQDIPHPERSGLFLYLNTDKLGVTLNLRKKDGRDIFEQLLKMTDVLIEDTPPRLSRELRLDYKTLRDINPGLIMTSITPFGHTGPYKDYKSDYLTSYHSGGEGYLIPGGPAYLQFPDRPPIKAGGFLGECDAGLCAALATLAAFFGREVNGIGQHVDISKQEALLFVSRPGLARYNENNFVESRATRQYGLGGIMPCKDGWIEILPALVHMWDGLISAMGNPAWAKDPRYDFSTLWRTYRETGKRGKEHDEANKYMEDWMMQHTKKELYSLLQDKGCPTGIVCTAEDILQSEQLAHREFFTEIDHPQIGRMKYPTVPYKFSETPAKVERHAPLLGEHNEEIYCERLGCSKQDLAYLRGAGVI